MVDHRQSVAGTCLPVYRMQGNYGDGVGGDIRREEFCFQARVDQERSVEAHHDDHMLPLPLWKNSLNESSPLLPSDHRYSNLSPRARLQAILEGRKQLMEMIQNLPESSYELSLKDLVDTQEQETREENKVETVFDQKSFRLETEDDQMIKNHKKKRKKKKSNKGSGRQITRSASMDSGIFLIKIFFPSFLGSKKKSSTSNKNGCSKVSPRTSFDVSEKEINDHYKDQQWINKSFFEEEGNMGNGKNCRSSRSSNSSLSRYVFS